MDIFAFLGLDDSGFEANVVKTAQRAGDKAGLSMGQRLAAGISASSGAIGQTLGTVGKSLSSTGRSMTTSLTLPILAVGGAAAHLALDFDTAMRRIQGLAKVPETEIAGVRDSVLKMAQDIGRSPQELAEAFYFVASAGFKADEALKVLEISARASASGMGETSDIAKVLGGTINAYGHENLTAAHAGDVLTAAIQDGAAEAADFAGSIGMVVPNAAALGVSFDQVAAAMSAMTQVGVDAQTAAVNLGQIFSSLQKPTKEAEATLEALGTSAEGLRTELREKGLLATLRDLEQRFAGNEEATAKVFGNIRALRGVTQLLGLDEAQLNGIFADTAGALGTLQTAYDETDGPQRQLDKAMAELQVTAIELGADVLPFVVEILHDLAGAAKALSAWWKTLDDGTKGLIIHGLALAAALGPVLLVVGKLTSGVGALFKGISLLTGKKGLGVVGATAKLGLLAIALGVTLEAAMAAGGAIDDFFTEIAHGKKGLNTIKELESIVGNRKFAEQLFNWGVSVEDFNRLVEQAGGDARTAFQAIVDSGGNVGQALSDLGADMSGMSTHWADAWRSVSTSTTTGVGGILVATKKAGEAVPENLSAELVDGQFQVGAAAEEMVDPIAAAMDQAIADTAAAADDLISTLATTLAEGPKEIREEVKALRESLNNIYKGASRRADIEAALANKVIIDALKSGDPKIAAAAAEQVKGWMEEYDLLAPGALARGKLVNPSLKAGIQSNYAALLTYLTSTVIPGIEDPFDLADTLDAMGYAALAAYVRGMERARLAKLSGALATLQGQMLRAAKINLFPTGFDVGAAYLDGVNAGIDSKMPTFNAKTDAILRILKMSGSPPYTHAIEAGEGVGESYTQRLWRALREGLRGMGGYLSASLMPGFSVPSLTGSAGYAAGQGVVAPAPVVGGGNTYNVTTASQPREKSMLEIAHELRRADYLGALPGG